MLATGAGTRVKPVIAREGKRSRTSVERYINPTHTSGGKHHRQGTPVMQHVVLETARNERRWIKSTSPSSIASLAAQVRFSPGVAVRDNCGANTHLLGRLAGLH